MARYIRPRRPGAAIFFTVSLAEPGSDLLVRHLPLLGEAMRRTRAEHPFTVEAMVVLPDHLHAILRLPRDDTDYPLRWRLIKARFSRMMSPGPLRPSHRDRGERGIWQRRYWEHHLRGPVALTEAREALWRDPVGHGLAARPADWPHSTLHREIAAGRLAPTWA